MKFGVREICDVVLRRKAAGWFGKLYLEKDMPVLYFDTLKTSNLEGAATTVYAQGGKGNPRLVAWEGDRTVTFTMEDALISPQSFSILSGAGFMDASEAKPIFVHQTSQLAVQAIDEAGNLGIKFETKPSYGTAGAPAEMFLMFMDDNGNINNSIMPIRFAPEAAAEGNPADYKETYAVSDIATQVANFVKVYNEAHDGKVNGFKSIAYSMEDLPEGATDEQKANHIALKAGDVVFVDYYVKAETGVKQIDIEADKFGGSYYLEASTLFRDQATGEDHPAEFIIPNCKVQSNFTFTMAPSGDPSTFTFTMDAFPDYTKFDGTKKVLAALQIVEDKDGFGALKG